ncbi:hypothetical protein [Streptomyces sannanensis]|uniref:hypothetical protein n=1 Tax=Streptomyces sannanensis TaxID=285536 RepID=UPI0031E6E63C
MDAAVEVAEQAIEQLTGRTPPAATATWRTCADSSVAHRKAHAVTDFLDLTA